MAKQAVYGIAKDKKHAEKLVQTLIDNGIPHSDVSFLASNQSKEFGNIDEGVTSEEVNRNWRTEERLTDYPTGTTPEGKFQHGPGSATNWQNATSTTSHTNKGTSSTSPGQHSGLGTEKHSKAPEGATTGGITGGIIGGTLGLLAGIGALAIPGLGPFIAAGPLMATLAGIGSGGTIGGIVGALIGSGIPEYEAKRYENRLKEGGVLVAVHADSDATAKRVKEVLQNAGAENVTVSSEASASKNYNK